MKRGWNLVALIVLTLAFIVVLFTSVADASGGSCKTYHNHSGHVPAGWTATFYEDRQAYGPYDGPTFVSPTTAGQGNKTWDKAVKCKAPPPTTSTTVPDPTTTTTHATTTTTEAETTTTTTTEATTTTTEEETTTTSVVDSTTTMPPTTTELTLPFTGVDSAVMLRVGIGFLIGGILMLVGTRRPRT